jgi:Family of unknown function (DUF6787)
VREDAVNEATPTQVRPRRLPRRVWNALETRWGVTGWGAIAILAAFALSGMSVIELAYPIVHAIVPHDAPRWQYYTVKLLIVIPVYEVLLLIWGALLGQGRFFRLKLRQTLRFISRPFRRGR